MKFHHIGLVVSDISQAADLMKRDLKIKKSSKIFIDKEIDVKIQFLKLNDKSSLELIEPLSNKSPIKNFLNKKNSSNIHHLAYTCKNIEEVCKTFRNRGYGFLTKFFRSNAFNGAKVVFLLSPLNFILELIEKK